jgi:hypothetical protein
MVSQKGNPFLWKAIWRIVMNVKKHFYGRNPLEPTGPWMLGKILLRNGIRQNIDLRHYKGGGYIIYKNRFVISTEYSDYNKERSETYKTIKTKRYADLWNERKIYK